VRTTGQTDKRKLTIAFRDCFADMPKMYDDGETSNGIMAMSNVGNIRRNDSNDTMWEARTHRIYA
jgi:hypothetical protein